MNILTKKMMLINFVISKLWTPKTQSDKCLKISIWKEPLTSDMVNLPKHCWNMHDSIFIRFYNHCQVNWVGESLCFWHAISWDYLLIETIWRYHFRCSYLRHKFCLNFFQTFRNPQQISNILNKNITVRAFAFPKIQTLKTWLNKCLKSPLSEDHSISNMVNVPKHCWTLHHSTFIIFIGHWQRNCLRKSLSYLHAKSCHLLLTHWLPMKRILFLIEKI